MVAAVTDDWISSATRDGGVVAEMLLRLKEAKVTPAVFTNPAVAALRWGFRQPRSRSQRCDGVSQRKETDSAKNSRCSPSTPLSWSGGSGGGGGSSSPSTCADGYEATSCQTSGSLAVGSRSKVLITEASAGSGSKRSRRKKTFAELKEEEGNLLKERICLEKEIASLRATFDEHGAEKHSLKRMKLDLKNVHQTEPSSRHHLEHCSGGGDGSTTIDHHCKNEEEVKWTTTDGSFLLPDLNMTPPPEENGNGYPSLGVWDKYKLNGKLAINL
ncbi:PREDICTED: uncharacterized protein LOC104799044 isoform X1 [Tarenaya hassleriana]|uniref:uncharacterized protein LOC104799044 isoform X1 n=1 Tax=Tarenaya hassleriana TaxID=28532 RepID=UPI00053C1DA2|nr:PREDICTED: uncharacterized protein LOC104799044 isoform X1 [Tarenaya hassleriana]